ncbi:MAG: TetR/AcrR family transcriptional regulator [Anaerolineae bacterium]
MDRRQQKTREAIFNAFNRLLSQENYSRITVQEIIDEANVGRSTFYAHFETKDELLKTMCTDIFEHVVSEHHSSEATHDFSGKDDAADSIVAHILYHLRDNRKNIIGILTCESGDLFLRYFKQYLSQALSHQFGQDIERCKALPADFLLNHISSSLVEMVNWWIHNDMKQSPEELESYFVAVVKPVIEQ